jgi:predicted porin
MKLRAIVFAALAGLAALGGGAAAQSSVTIFGVVDLAGRVVSNDDRQYQLASGGERASRIGFRGTDDLGGGLSAGFWLEAPLDPDTGSPDFDFSRQATVSLVSRTMGELRLGRDKVPTYYEWLEFDVFGDGGLGASTRLGVASAILPSDAGLNTQKRADNLVGWFTPGGLGGFFAQLGVTAGEGQLGDKYYGGRIGYREGPIAASASWGKTQVSGTEDAVTWAIGGDWDFKVIRLAGFYSSLEIGGGSQDNWQIGASAPFDSWLLRGSVSGMSGGGSLSNQEALRYALGVVYSLSKRTALYTTYASIDNTNTAFVVASGPPLTRGNRSSGLDFGLRHSF